MCYAIRKDGAGWRAVNGPEDVSGDETFSETHPAPRLPTLAENIATLEYALDDYLDNVARKYRFSDRTRLALRAGYPNNWQSLAIAFGTWMDDVNERASQYLQDVIDGKRTLPTKEELLAEIPPFEFVSP